MFNPNPPKELSDEQIRQAHELRGLKMTIRKISAEMGISTRQVTKALDTDCSNNILKMALNRKWS